MHNFFLSDPRRPCLICPEFSLPWDVKPPAWLYRKTVRVYVRLTCRFRTFCSKTPPPWPSHCSQWTQLATNLAKLFKLFKDWQWITIWTNAESFTTSLAVWVLSVCEFCPSGVAKAKNWHMKPCQWNEQPNNPNNHKGRCSMENNQKKKMNIETVKASKKWLHN